ncbi:hypothetical protein DPSP01_011426 [Paraphaeosphaeria sporulosa]|uniref:Concanavalin A-like lectin/glucanase n=1 Tax=Paraphaeosphaeria sporulosa TaxID=1460663 RepID=A0A177CHK4_9PLEO|nr:uncharacterized protein CC84DRAFT_1176303 [Paraphaeosphaeria sporulosa]OAG06270.1 hypothetical protein CC84DRAFT_1176303 [Paraphaeosphaeria sporulosa]
MSFTKLSLLCTLPLLALGAKFKRATPDEFGLFGYGQGFGGFPLFYADGYAYLGEPSSSNSSDPGVVTFTPSGSGTSQSWIGNPNTTLTNYTVSWSDVTFAVPTVSSSDRRVRFLTNETSDSDVVTTGFYFYGSTAFVVEGGKLESPWYALQVSERVHALYWNDTSLGQVPVILRNNPPSNPQNVPGISSN